MKISIGFKYTENAYGGGNNFVKNFTTQLIKDGYKVVFDLKDRDIDFIILINPLKSSEFSTFDNVDILYYQNFKNKNAISIQRFNECDERKATTNINKKLIKKNKNIDFNVFVSHWLSDIFDSINESKPFKVIMGGPDSSMFNQLDKKPWSGDFPINMITHHWSNHKNKGFDVYEHIDNLLDNKFWRNRLNFTIVGNVPNSYKYRNTKVIKPLKGFEIASYLKSSDIYITASKNEPSGNHHMEAAMCGLPILYMKSGGVEEYCRDYGVEFTLVNFESSINKLMLEYSTYFDRLQKYPYTFHNLYKEYIEIFEKLNNNSQEIINNRSKVNKNVLIIKYFLNKLVKKIRVIIVKCMINIGNFKKTILWKP